MTTHSTFHLKPVEGITRWLIVISVMLVAVIEVLDTTIVNVALSHMMGALGATRDQITWVLTSYIVSAAIVMPLTGFLVDLFGRKRFLLICIAGFLIASMLCGLSQSLFQIVVFRIMQGLFGAALIPLSQYILLDTFSTEEHGKAMAIWGIGIMVGPICGPTLGGYITDLWNWRWIFYINVPFCLMAFLMAVQVVQETPIRPREIDWAGIFWMALGIGCLQIFLDRGQTEDWFESKLIIAMMAGATICLTVFVVRGLNRKNNVINLHLFANSNFTYGCILMVMFAMSMFSTITLQPIMMQQLMSYSPQNAGLVMAPRGLSSAITMLFVGRFITMFDPRIFIIVGLFDSVYTSYLMSQFNLQTSFEVMAWVSFIQGVGIGLFFVPLTTLTLSMLPSSAQAEGSGLFNFARNLGISIGISLISTFVARSSQVNWNYLIEKFSTSSPNFQNWLAHHGMNMQDPHTIAFMSLQIAQQSSMVAFVNAYWLIGLCYLVTIPLVFFLKKPAVIKPVMME